MNKIILIFSVAFFIAFNVNAQYYENSAGLRLGGSSGFTYKKFVTEIEAFEILLSSRDKGMQVSGLYMWNKPLNLGKNETFFFYFGGGAHTGYIKYNTRILYIPPSFEPESFNYYYDEKSYFAMGVDALLGIEYRFLTIPITIAIDTKPYFSFVGFRYTRADFWDSSFAIKYTF